MAAGQDTNHSTSSSSQLPACRACGSREIKEVVREQISDLQVIARYRCARCQAEYLRFVSRPIGLTLAGTHSPSDSLHL